MGETLEQECSEAMNVNDPDAPIVKVIKRVDAEKLRVNVICDVLGLARDVTDADKDDLRYLRRNLHETLMADQHPEDALTVERDEALGWAKGEAEEQDQLDVYNELEKLHCELAAGLTPPAPAPDPPDEIPLAAGQVYEDKKGLRTFVSRVEPCGVRAGKLRVIYTRILPDGKTLGGSTDEHLFRRDVRRSRCVLREPGATIEPEKPEAVYVVRDVVTPTEREFEAVKVAIKVLSESSYPLERREAQVLKALLARRVSRDAAKQEPKVEWTEEQVKMFEWAAEMARLSTLDNYRAEFNAILARGTPDEEGEE